MITKKVNLSNIHFERVDPGHMILESIRKRGIAIPVRVRFENGNYICIDGRKRLSACEILGKEKEKFLYIPVMILNDFSKSGSAFWGNTQNHH